MMPPSLTPPDPIERLVLELGRLPGIGPRSAERLAHYIIRLSPREGPQALARDLAAALTQVAEQVRLCSRCRHLATAERCSLCSDERRQQQLVCIVESVGDLQAIERSRGFRGSYFVLHGTLSPLDGVGPERLGLELLQRRVASEPIEEVILACNATLEGDTTALYVASVVAEAGIKVSRLAAGVPQGGELCYLDQATLGQALRERRAFAAAPS